MFPKARRIHTARDIIRVLRKGERRQSGPVTLFFFPRPGQVSRATVIVDTKVAKRAVQRNLMKRRVRALLRGRPLPAGDLVVRLYGGAEKLDFPALNAEIEKCLRFVIQGGNGP